MSAEYINDFEWPSPLSIVALGEAIGRARDLTVVVGTIPPELRDPRLSGLTVIDESTAHVFYDPDLSALNRVQTILHEYAHILNYDVRPGVTYSHARTTVHSDIERKAELTATFLMEEYARRQRPGSDILGFLAGRSRRG